MTDAEPARALVHGALGGTRYLARTLELLDAALAGNDLESVGLVHATTGAVDALLLHGAVAGASAVEKLHALLGGNPASLRHLIDALCATSVARMIICELPHASEFSGAAAALEANGFTREGSVSCFFTEDTALDLLVRRRSDVSV